MYSSYLSAARAAAEADCSPPSRDPDPSSCRSSTASVAPMRLPTEIWGSEESNCSFRSRSAIRGFAISNAFTKECVFRSASLKYASPKYVQSASLLQPKELRSAADAVITSVSGLSRGFTNPPE
jgi:hypothetical protein